MNPAVLYRASRPEAVAAARVVAAADYVRQSNGWATSQAVYPVTPTKPPVGYVAYLYQRAVTAELNDPEPRANLRQSYCCLPCHVWYTNVRQNA